MILKKEIFIYLLIASQIFGSPIDIDDAKEALRLAGHKLPIKSRFIIDSRGNPTVEAEIYLNNGNAYL